MPPAIIAATVIVCVGSVMLLAALWCVSDRLIRMSKELSTLAMVAAAVRLESEGPNPFRGAAVLQQIAKIEKERNQPKPPVDKAEPAKKATGATLTVGGR